jgi:uncharacterized protein YgbK (DUF1537 family)
MDEADLRMHLAKQTSKPISLLNVLHVAGSTEAAEREFDRLAAAGPQVMLIDGLHEQDLLNAGHLIARQAEREKPLFVVGSSGVESALTAHWQNARRIADFAGFPPVGPAGPIVVVSGSCSPVTAGQIEWALGNGFGEVALDTPALVDTSQSEQLISAAASQVVAAVRGGQSVIIHAGRGPGDERIARTLTALRRPGESDSSVRGRTSEAIGTAQGTILRRVLEAALVRRVVLAGGDTSSQIARALAIESVEMIGELTRGSPLCRASAPGSPADGIEITFKGGQIGRREFFGSVLNGGI